MAVKKTSKRVQPKKQKNNRLVTFLATNSLKRNALIFVSLFALLGSVFLIKSFAAATVANVEAETLIGSGLIVTDNQAQQGKALKLTTANQAIGNFTLPAKADKISVRAKGTSCKGAPILNVAIDGQQVSLASVSSTTWTLYNSTVNLTAQSHVIATNLTNPYSRKNCARTVTVDAIAFVDTTAGTTPAADTTLPTVTINAPTNGSTVTGVTSFTAAASDNVAVAKVEFYVNGVLSSSVTATPYNYSWDTTTKANGTYQLSAKAYDAAGNNSSSSPVSVTVSNQAPPTSTVQYPTGCSGVNVAPGSDLAAAVNAATSGTTLCIASGEYRLSSTLAPKTNMTLWGAQGATLNGSRLISKWTQQGSYWAATGFAGVSNGGGQCDDNVTNPCLPTDQVFMDDVHLSRVMSLASLTTGKFYIDYMANVVYLADNPTGKKTEIARTDYAIRTANPGVVIRGLTIEKYAPPAQKGAIFAEGDNWTIKDNLVRANHAIGIFLSGSDGTKIDSNTIEQNGQLGIGQYNSTVVTISNNTITGNNTDGFWIADWESGGYKTTNSPGNFVGNTVTNNLGVGAWVDVDGNGVTLDSNTITGNAADGIRYEISYNGVIKNNVIKNNGFGMKRGADYSIYAVAGINVNSSTNVDIYGNTVADNANGIGLQMRNRGSGKYGVWALTNATVHNNTITMKSGTQWGQGATGLVQNVSDNSYFTSKGNRFYDNTYYLDSQTAKRFAWNNTYNTAAAWRAAGQDVNGVFK
ncbi:MAG: right-handed parallel beta-helix repeat-containing protein [Candidatus Saccharimonadales bacterium]